MLDPQVFRKAAQLIRDHGHCKGTYLNKGEFCIAGALFIAKYGEIPVYGEMLTVAGSLENETKLLLEIIGDQPVHWNDRPERTAKEVIAVLETCAAIEQAKLEQRHENRSISREDKPELVLAL